MYGSLTPLSTNHIWLSLQRKEKENLKRMVKNESFYFGVRGVLGSAKGEIIKVSEQSAHVPPLPLSNFLI